MIAFLPQKFHNEICFPYFVEKGTGRKRLSNFPQITQLVEIDVKSKKSSSRVYTLNLFEVTDSSPFTYKVSVCNTIPLPTTFCIY